VPGGQIYRNLKIFPQVPPLIDIVIAIGYICLPIKAKIESKVGGRL
jgi:hypothetical protein